MKEAPPSSPRAVRERPPVRSPAFRRFFRSVAPPKGGTTNKDARVSIHRSHLACFIALCLAAASPACAAETQGQPPPAPFDLLDFRIDGNQVLDARAVERAIYPHLGPGRTVEDVEKARADLEQAFHQAGYETVFVDIPEQDVVNGMVVLQVVESSVARLRVTGSRYFSLGKVKEKVPALAEGAVPHLPTVQTQLAELAKQSADLKVTPVIRAGNTPGRLDVDLQVEDRLPLHASVEMNSRNSLNTGYTRLSASLRYDNLWQSFHSASLQYFVSPQNADEVEVWSGTYAFPTGFADGRVALYGIGISSNTGVSSGGALSVVGSGNIWGARYVQPLPMRGGFLHTATLGVDYKNFGQGLRLVGADTLNTPIHYLPFLAEYGAVWRGESFRSAANVGLHFSIRGLGNSAQEFEDKRHLARPNYFYLAGDFAHDQALPGDFRLALRFAGQWADSPLVSNEQFAAGGPSGLARVRGYHQTEWLGDDAVAGSVELHGPAFDYEEWVSDLRGLVFVEGATLWTLHAPAGTPSVSHLASAGLGLRLQWWKHFAGEFDWGYPLIATPGVRAGEQRVDFRVAYEL